MISLISSADDDFDDIALSLSTYQVCTCQGDRSCGGRWDVVSSHKCLCEEDRICSRERGCVRQRGWDRRRWIWRRASRCGYRGYH